MDSTMASLFATSSPPDGIDRERLLTAILEIATMPAFDLDPEHDLHELCAESAAALRLTGCAVLLSTPPGPRAVGWSGPIAKHLVEWQVKAATGPAIGAVTSGDAVSLPDMGDADGPFAVECLRSGVGATTAVPLAGGGTVIGVLQFFGTAGRLSRGRMLGAVMVAAIAETAIGNAIVCRQSSALAVQLSHALESRVPIEQAKGLLAERHHIELCEAFRMLRVQARRNRMPLSRIAQDVLAGRTTVAPVTEAARPAGATTKPVAFRPDV